MGAHAESSPTHPAIHGAREWFTAGAGLLEPGGPTRTPGVAAGYPCEPTKDSFADFVSTLPGIDRRPGSTSQGRGPPTSPGTKVDDASGSWSRHGVSHRSVLG